jgi:hypothetical protein
MAGNKTGRALAGIGGSVLALAIAAFVYTNHAVSAEGQNFCALVDTFNQAYRDTPPTTPTGQVVAAEMSRLYQKLHCPGIGAP